MKPAIDINRTRDALLVEELRKTANKYRTDQNRDNYTNAAEWFMKKHACLFSECLPKEHGL